MLTHLLLISARRFYKRKIELLLTLFSLSLALTVSIIVFVISYSELTWDSFWPKSDQIYKVESIYNYQTRKTRTDSLVLSLRDPLKSSFQEIEYAGRVSEVPSIVSKNENSLSQDETKVSTIDDDIFRIFPPRVFAGDLNQFFNDKKSVVLSLDVAEKYFPKESPIGKTLNLNGLISYM